MVAHHPASKNLSYLTSCELPILIYCSLEPERDLLLHKLQREAMSVNNWLYLTIWLSTPYVSYSFYKRQSNETS
jgi:hypothetical protein